MNAASCKLLEAFGAIGRQLVAFPCGNCLILIPLSMIVSAVYLSERKQDPTCSWTQPSFHSHLSVVVYCAYDMFVLASKHHDELASVEIFLPLQKSGQIVCGPEAYPGWCCFDGSQYIMQILCLQYAFPL